MKIHAMLIAVILLSITSGCAELSNAKKHMQSSLTGLNRKIVLYNASGGVIREWKTSAKVEDNGGTCYFVIDGKAVTISGTFVIEEVE